MKAHIDISENQNKNYDSAVTFIKGVAMIIVVLSHVMQVNNPSNGVPKHIFSMIISFHMP